MSARQWDVALDAKLEVAASMRRIAREMGGDPNDPASRASAAYGRAEDIEQTEPIWMAPEVLPLALAAVDQWKPQPASSPEILLNGFLLLPRVLVAGEVGHADVPVRAVSWVTTHQITDADDGSLHDGIAVMGYGLDEYGWTVLATDKDDPESEFEGHGIAFGDTKMMESADSIRTPYFNFVQPLIALLEQHVIVQRRERPSKHAARRAERAKVAADAVTVITLRRPEHQAVEEERPVDWAVRWLVRAHWRQQWYPSLGAHKPVLIAGYVKGPEDKPLRVTSRVWSFVR